MPQTRTCWPAATPARQKTIKLNSLLANCVIFHAALDMTEVIRQLIIEGCPSIAY